MRKKKVGMGKRRQTTNGWQNVFRILNAREGCANKIPIIIEYYLISRECFYILDELQTDIFC